MKIAILAWGSLVWEPRNLQTKTGFVPVGPVIPIEFSRVSQDKRLTLVIDEANGAPSLTYVAQSAHGDIETAKKNLKEREGMKHVNGVGFIDLATNAVSKRAKERHPEALESIRLWAKASGYDGVIWTALASNFHEDGRAGQPFSVDAAMEYLGGLNEPERDAALNYIRSAPVEVASPIRAAAAARWPQV